MRVTETRMIEMSTAAMTRAREQAADAGQKLQTGVRVNRPSDDAAAWEQGMRADARAALSARRGSAIAGAQDRLAQTDGALDGVGSVLSRVTELAVQLASGTYNASDRADAAKEVVALRDAALASANSRGADGEYILAGSRGATVPFDAAGAYTGDAGARQIEAGEGQNQTVGVPGSVLTAAAGVDVFGVLQNVIDALQTNNVATLQTSIADLRSSVAQVADARAEVGGRMRALDTVEGARQGFEQSLAETKSRAVQIDPIAAASEFARASTALDVARTVSQQIIAGIRR
jgi:flagellar hook-associated protein 3 FlgL